MLQEEHEKQQLHNEVLRGHRLPTMTERLSSPPLPYARNGALPPIGLADIPEPKVRTAISKDVSFGGQKYFSRIFFSILKGG